MLLCQSTRGEYKDGSSCILTAAEYSCTRMEDFIPSAPIRTSHVAEEPSANQRWIGDAVDIWE